MHQPPNDLIAAVRAESKALATWGQVTPLAKNEWSCWVLSAAKPETRARRVRIAIDKLRRGERRPCCWAGCPHRDRIKK